MTEFDPECTEGWTLRELQVNRVAPELLVERNAAVEAWKRAGEPLVFAMPGYGLHPASKRMNLANSQVERHLRAILSSGDVECWGQRGSPTAELSRIPPGAWRRISIRNLDLSEAKERTKEGLVIYGIKVFLKELFHGKPIASDTVRSNAMKADGAPHGTATREAAVRACIEWLASEMRASPTARPRAKREYMTEARAKWPGLISKDTFEFCWKTAINNTGATSWSDAGRPKKNRPD